MIYKVILAGYAICRPDIMCTLPSIPGTEEEETFNTESPEYEIIWGGYVELRESQKRKPCNPADWECVKVSENAEHIDQFREALNLFTRYLAGEGRDNCKQVKSICVVPA